MKKIWLIGFVVILVFLSGCANEEPGVQPSETTDAAPGDTHTMTATPGEPTMTITPGVTQTMTAVP